MTLAFIDSPVQLAVAMLVILIVFGPQKLPEIGQQLGRAIRELKRSTQEFSSIVNTDDYEYKGYEPPKYDSYGNEHSSSTVYNSPQDTVPTASTVSSHNAGAAEVPHGDFAASAMADSAEDYGIARPQDPQ